MSNPLPWSGPPSVTVPAGQKFSIRFADYPDANLEFSFDPETGQAVMNFPVIQLPSDCAFGDVFGYSFDGDATAAFTLLDPARELRFITPERLDSENPSFSVGSVTPDGGGVQPARFFSLYTYFAVDGEGAKTGDEIRHLDLSFSNLSADSWSWSKDGIRKANTLLLDPANPPWSAGAKPQTLTVEGAVPILYVNDTQPTAPDSWYWLAQGGTLYWGIPGANYARVVKTAGNITNFDLLWAMCAGGKSAVAATTTGVGILTDAPATGLAVEGPVESLGDSALILKDELGGRWKITINSSGVITPTAL